MEKQTRELSDAIMKYKEALQKKRSCFLEQLKKEFDLFVKNNAKKNFTINGIKLSLNEFMLLFGNEKFYSKGFGTRWIFYGEKDIKNSFREVEKYLRSISGMVMPEVPKILKKWLLEDNDDNE